MWVCVLRSNTKVTLTERKRASTFNKGVSQAFCSISLHCHSCSGSGPFFTSLKLPSIDVPTELIRAPPPLCLSHYMVSILSIRGAACQLLIITYSGFLHLFPSAHHLHDGFKTQDGTFYWNTDSSPIILLYKYQ